MYYIIIKYQVNNTVTVQISIKLSLVCFSVIVILLSNAVSDISILLNIIVNICVWSSNGSYHSVDYRSYVVLWLNYWNFLAYKNIFQYTKKKIPHIINNFKPRLISHHVLNCYWVCLWNQWFNHNTVKCYMSWENQHYHYSLCEQMWRLGPWFTLLYEPIPLDKALFTWYCHISPWKHMLKQYFSYFNLKTEIMLWLLAGILGRQF